MKQHLIYLLLLILLVACESNSNQRRVYAPDASNEEEISTENNETDEKHISNLPFAMDSLDYLYFPIGKVDLNPKRKVKAYMSSSSSSVSYDVGHTGRHSISGKLSNLMIRPKGSENYHLLTSDKVSIRSLNYLFRLDTIHQRALFVYEVMDTDSNQDGELDSDDLRGLYLSKPNGENFKRISPVEQHLLNWQVYPEKGLLYFRTLEDTDSNGMFNHKDMMHMYALDLLNKAQPKLVFNEDIYKSLKAKAMNP